MDQTQAARYICRALRETVDVAADWAYGERARETLVNGGDSALTPSGSEDHDPERDPVSIHIPLHRFAAILVNAAFVAESVDADGSPVLDAPLTCPNLSSVLTDHPFTVQIHALAEHPIRALAWSDAVRARSWVRNGEEVRRLSSVYASRYWAGLGRDADLALLQYALASSHAPHEVATRLLDAGCRAALLPLAETGTQEATTPRAASRGYVEGGGEAVTDGEPSPTRRRTGGSRRQSTDRRRSMDTDQPDANLISTDPHGEPSTPSDENPNSTSLRYRDPKTLRPWDLECARSASRTLVGLAKDRCWLSNNPFEIRVRRELVHALAVESRTHSELSDLLPTNLASENNDVDKVLTQVAVYEPPRTLDDKGKYSLKADMWREFDGFFHRFAPTDSESALRNAVTAYITQRKEGVAEEDCAWHPRDMLSAPHVAPPPFAGVLRFARHPSIATFVHDCVCYLREQRNEPDLQDVAVSAMAIAALALDDRVFVEHLRDVGGSLSGKSGTFPDPWARALLHGSTADSNSVDESSARVSTRVGVPRRRRGRRVARGGVALRRHRRRVRARALVPPRGRGSGYGRTVRRLGSRLKLRIPPPPREGIPPTPTRWPSGKPRRWLGRRRRWHRWPRGRRRSGSPRRTTTTTPRASQTPTRTRRVPRKPFPKTVPTGFRGTEKACAACAAGPRRRVPRASTTA